MKKNNKPKKIIISVGGSLIVPSGGIDTEFLSKFNDFIRTELANDPNRQFFLVVGGGSAARQYRDAGRDVIGHDLTPEDLDWLGIHATRLNAQLVKTIFKDIAHQYLIKNFEIIRKVTEPVVIAAGWKPGWSTDYCATLVCEDYDVPLIINLSNTDKVYDKDPNKYKDAKAIDTLSWKAFRKLVGEKWVPGMHAPFDPVAARRCDEFGIKVVVMSGSDLSNVSSYLSGDKFVGTVIE